MGLFKFIKKQLINVIEWTDTDVNTMVYRFPVDNKEIKNGAQLTVRESQVAIFVHEGEIADVFKPGRYQLTTANIPVLTKLNSWKYGFNSPFKAEVYFVNTRQFTNLKWGTSNPIPKKDAEFGIVRVRAFGNFSMKVDDAAIFLKEVFGTLSSYSTKNITDHVKTMVVSSFTDYMAETQIPVLDLATAYDEIGEGVTGRVSEKLKTLGLKSTSVIIENISLPKEVEEAIDKRSSMSAIGDMQTYMQYQAADSIKDAAKNTGGIAGMGVGLGAGVGFGKIMGDAMGSATQQPAKKVVLCPSCNHENAEGTKFCANCGKPLSDTKTKKCVKCGHDIPINSKFCPECSAPQVVKCECGHEVDANTKFCPECGKQVKK